MKSLRFLFWLGFGFGAHAAPLAVDDVMTQLETNPGAESEGQLLELVGQLLPRQQKDFNKETYETGVAAIFTLRGAHPEAAEEMLIHLDNRCVSLYQKTTLEIEQEKFGVTTAAAGVGFSATSLLAATRPAAARLLRLRSPVTQVASPLVGLTVGSAYFYFTTKAGWSLSRLPTCPLSLLGFNVEGYSLIDRADKFNVLPDAVNVALFLAPGAFIWNRVQAATNRLAKEVVCARGWDRIGAAAVKHPKLRKAASWVVPLAVDGVAFHYFRKGMEQLSTPLEQRAYRNNYLRALAALGREKPGSVREVLALQELYRRTNEWAQILKNRRFSELAKAMDDLPDTGDDEQNTRSLMPLLQRLKFQSTDDERKAVAFLDTLEADPRNLATNLATVHQSVKPEDIDSPAMLYLFNASILAARGLPTGRVSIDYYTSATSAASFLKQVQVAETMNRNEHGETK